MKNEARNEGRSEDLILDTNGSVPSVKVVWWLIYLWDLERNVAVLIILLSFEIDEHHDRGKLFLLEYI